MVLPLPLASISPKLNLISSFALNEAVSNLPSKLISPEAVCSASDLATSIVAFVTSEALANLAILPTLSAFS